MGGFEEALAIVEWQVKQRQRDGRLVVNHVLAYLSFDTRGNGTVFNPGKELNFELFCFSKEKKH